jgi:hypothetical protein
MPKLHKPLPSKAAKALKSSLDDEPQTQAAEASSKKENTTDWKFNDKMEAVEFDWDTAPYITDDHFQTLVTSLENLKKIDSSRTLKLDILPRELQSQQDHIIVQNTCRSSQKPLHFGTHAGTIWLPLG